VKLFLLRLLNVAAQIAISIETACSHKKDARHKAGHDDFLWLAGSSPAMTWA